MHLDIITKPFRFRYFKNADNGVENTDWRPIKSSVESKSDLFCLSFLTRVTGNALRVSPRLIFSSPCCPYVKVFVLFKTARRQKEKNSWIQGTHQLAAPLAVSSTQASYSPSPARLRQGIVAQNSWLKRWNQLLFWTRVFPTWALSFELIFQLPG